MPVNRKQAPKGQLYHCPSTGHLYPKALVVEGLGQYDDGEYCLLCFNERVIRRLGVPRVQLIDDPYLVKAGPEETQHGETTESKAADESSSEAETQEGQEGDAGNESATNAGDEPAGEPPAEPGDATTEPATAESGDNPASQ